MKSLQKKLAKGEIYPVYRIFGDDAIVMKQAYDMLVNACEISLPDLNQSVFDDDNFDAEKIILSCEQLPIMSKKRLVVVKNIAKIKDADLKKLEQYCQNPIPDTVLVFYEIVGGTIFTKLTTEKISCKKLAEEELIKIVNNLFAENNISISEENAKILIQFCSNDLLRIKNEITKLSFCGEKDITESTIKKLVKKNDEFSIFEISSALTYGQGDKAIVLIKKMLEEMEFPVILGLISSHFRRLLYSVISEGTNAEIADKLGVKEFAITKAKSSAKNLSAKQILKINEIILNVDYDIKSGKISSENAMYYLVFAILEVLGFSK